MKKYKVFANSHSVNPCTIKSVSDEGTYFLVKDWRKNKELWVSKDKMDNHPEWWFTSSGKAKQSLKSLLSVMDEYLSDTFTVVDMSGNETPLDVKELGFDYIPDYDDDIDACTSVKSNSYASSHKRCTNVTKEVLDYTKKKYPTLYKELSDKDIWITIWGDGEYSLSYNSIKDPNTFLSDSVKQDFMNTMEELYPGSFWGDLVDIDACNRVTSSNKTRYMANMVNADTDIDEDFDPKYDCKYHANSYYGTNYSGLEDDFHTDDPSELMSWVWDHAAEGGYVEVSGPKGSVRLDPDELAERVEFGDIGEYEIISQIDYV